jgi:hypothetical protein
VIDIQKRLERLSRELDKALGRAVRGLSFKDEMRLPADLRLAT